MSRVLLLVLLFVWMTRTGNASQSELAAVLPRWLGVMIFLGGYLALVLVLGTWARKIFRQGGAEADRQLDRFQTLIHHSRYAIVVWLAVAIYGGLEWGYFVDQVFRHASWARHGHRVYELPRILVGVGPSLLAWMGLWWAQFPVERAMREQHILIRFDNSLPVHDPPSFRQFFFSNLRLQMLFLIAPALLLVAAHDLTVLVLSQIHSTWAADSELDQWIMLPMAALMYLFAPELLRRVAHSEPLADGPLRRRLEGMCHRAGLKYRDILLWKTQHSMSNAFVMGLFPRVRYVLLSDLLLETMDDRQIEAVFAHELGHVVHRHLWWLLLTCITVVCFVMGPLDQLQHALPLRWQHGWLDAALNFSVSGLGMLAAFGWLSRRFERQADVFAARTMQSEGVIHNQPSPVVPTLRHFLADDFPPLLVAGFAPFNRARGASGTSDTSGSYVGEYGAEVFAGALRRVAEVNNIPLDAWDLMHPNIAKRMRYLREMSGDRRRTRHFDQYMRRLYLILLASVLFLGAWATAQSMHPDFAVDQSTAAASDSEQ